MITLNIGFPIRMLFLTRIFFINSLEMGGAERYLMNYADQSQVSSSDKKILVLLRKSDFHFSEVSDVFDEILFLNIRSVFYLLYLLLFNPRRSVVLQSFLYRSNLVAGVLHVCSLCRQVHIIHIRSGRLDRSSSYLGIIVQKLVVWSSHIAKTGVIYNSHVGRDFHENIGISKQRSLVVWNGSSLDLTRQSIERLIEARIATLNSILTLTFVGRNDPLKNFDELRKAIVLLSKEKKCPHLKVYGHRRDEYSSITPNNIHFCGVESDLSCIYNCTTHYLILTSLDEACPNVLIEAANYGLPIITTDAGDAWIMFEKDKFRINGFLAEDIAETIRSVMSNLDTVEYRARAIASWERGRRFAMSRNVNDTDKWIRGEFFERKE